MKRKYSFLLAGLGLLALVSCNKKDNPEPTPPKPPVLEVTTVKEVTLQDNVMSYTPPQGQEDQYILSYENNVLKLKYDKAGGLRSTQPSLYGRQKGKDFISSDPKPGDVISISPNSIFPNGFVAKINQAEYGAGFVNIHTSATQINDVAKDINYSETINIVDLINREWGAGVGTVTTETDISSRLKLSPKDKDKNKEGSKTVQSFGGKVSAKIKGKRIHLGVSFDYVFEDRRGDKTKGNAKAGLKAALSFDPHLSFKIRKREKADLPELFEVSLWDDVQLDIDAELEAELKEKSSGAPIHLAIIPLPPIGIGALNLVSYLSVDLIFTLEGKVQAQLKILKYSSPYKYTVGYNESKSPRFYLNGDGSLRSNADWFNNWSLEASLNLGLAIRSALNVTINGWEDLRVSAGAGIETDTEIKTSADREAGELKVKSTYQPFFFAEAVFKPGVEWFEFNSERTLKPYKPQTIFEKTLAMAWNVRITPKEAWEITTNSAVLGGEIKLHPSNPPKLTEFGICLAQHSNPQLADQVLKYDRPHSILDYTIKATDLRPSTKYYYRGYAKYLSGGQTKTYYSASVKSFTTEIEKNGALENTTFSDDFNGTELDLNKWESPSYPNAIMVSDGILKMEQDITDAKIELFSKRHYMAKQRISVSRRLALFPANNNFFPVLELVFDNNRLLVIQYSMHSYGNSYGTYIRSYDGDKRTSIKEDKLDDPIFNAWFDEKFDIDVLRNELHYYQNGKLLGVVELKGLSLSTPFKVRMVPYGWYTGHKHYTDDFKLTVSSEPSGGGGSW